MPLLRFLLLLRLAPKRTQAGARPAMSDNGIVVPDYTEPAKPMSSDPALDRPSVAISLCVLTSPPNQPFGPP